MIPALDGIIHISLFPFFKDEIASLSISKRCILRYYTYIVAVFYSVNTTQFMFLAPQGALVVVVFLDISIQSIHTAYRFECSQLFYVKLWGQVKPS